MYCGHCAPCPAGINVAEVTRLLNLALAQGNLPENRARTLCRVAAQGGGECLKCGECEKRCPFEVRARKKYGESKRNIRKLNHS